MIGQFTGRPYRVDLGGGPTPAELIRRAEPAAALWGRWFDESAIVLPQPLLARRVEHAGDAFGLLDEQPALSAPTDPELLGGGWLACLGYAPGHSWIGFFDHIWRHRERVGWSFESLGLAGRERAAEESLAGLVALLAEAADALAEPAVDTPFTVGPFVADPGALTSHLRGVESVIAGIERGDYYQLNVCTRLWSRLRRPSSAAAMFAAVADRLRPAYGAMIRTGDGRALVGLSPELFWQERDGHVRSAPIKGTSPLAADPTGMGLAGSVKDKAENVMITDLMRNDLSRVCRPGTVSVERLLDLERHPGVWHLVSTVGGDLRPGISHGDLLRATFPPGSVTGAPKLSAMRGIAETEPAGRGAYTGAVGLLTPQAGAELSVIIRTFEIDGDRIELGVGGGITVDSVPMREWYECLHKAGPLVRALGTALAAELDVPAPTIPADLRAAGLIETMLARDGEVLRLAAHLARLDRSCRELYGSGLPAELPGRIRAAAQGCSGTRARVRVRVVPDGLRLSMAVECQPITTSPDRIRLVRRERPDWCWRHKWADRSALAEPPSPSEEAGEVLTLPYYLTPTGHLAESSRGNLCLRDADGGWVSPPETEHVLPGITRRDLLRALGARGERIRIDDVSLADLAGATTLLHCSSISGVLIVETVDGRVLPPDHYSTRLARGLNHALGFGDS